MDAQLTYDELGPALVLGEMVLRTDFDDYLPRLKKASPKTELALKAAKLSSLEAPSVLDACAGLGTDALIFASAGAKVTLCEKDPHIGILLQHTLTKAQHSQHELIRTAAYRMNFLAVDSIDYMQKLSAQDDLSARFDIVFLDPMFPEKSKKAATKKKLQLIQAFEAPEERENLLLEAALDIAKKKVIVKRPLKGPHLAGIAPAYSLSGKAIRMDVYLGRKHG